MAAGAVVLAALVYVAVLFAPLYIRNLKLQSYVDGLTHRGGNDMPADAVLRRLVLDEAGSLDLPVSDANVHILHTAEGLRIDVSYEVNVRAPLYQVNLHFYPGAGSR